MKNFTVNIDMRWSEDIKVKAKTKAEAKKIAWEKFKKKVAKNNFSISVDEDY